MSEQSGFHVFGDTHATVYVIMHNNINIVGIFTDLEVAKAARNGLIQDIKYPEGSMTIRAAPSNTISNHWFQ